MIVCRLIEFRFVFVAGATLRIPGKLQGPWADHDDRLPEGTGSREADH